MAKFKKITFLFLVLSSCTASSSWNVSHLQGSRKGFDSARLIYPIRDIVNGVAVEMIYSDDHLRTYVSVYSQAIPPHCGNVKEALVTLKASDQTFQAVAHRHEGGQRALLPTELQNILIQKLLDGESMTIELQGYSTTLNPDQFAAEYRKLRKAPFNLPFQLPFKLS